MGPGGRRGDLETDGGVWLLFRRMNSWLVSRSPWGYAAFTASWVAIGALGGAMLARWQQDVSLLDARVLMFAGTWFFSALLGGRLVASATLQTMRLQQQWKEEGRQQRLKLVDLEPRKEKREQPR